MDRRRVERWLTAYEKAWRTEDTEMLEELFTPGIVYLTAPWAEPVAGLDALSVFWEEGRRSAAEAFAMNAEVLAVEMETAVAHVDVDYDDPPRQWRNLWVMVFAPGGRCSRFEEWPFRPGQPDGHEA